MDASPNCAHKPALARSSGLQFFRGIKQIKRPKTNREIRGSGPGAEQTKDPRFRPRNQTIFVENLELRSIVTLRVTVFAKYKFAGRAGNLP
jgi:hypothetical protein